MRGTRAAVAARVDVVYRLKLLGLDRQHVLEHIEKKYPKWGCKPCTIDTYIAKAKVLIRDVGRYDRALEFGRALARLHDLYARCVTDRRYRDALAVQREICELLGLKAPQKIEVTEFLSLLDAEIIRTRREVEELEQLYGLESPLHRGA